jgi:hypothetical protein
LDAGTSHGSPARRRRPDHHDLEEIAGAIGADHEISRWILTELGPRDGLAEGMIDVVIGDTVSAGRRMDLHTE